MHQCDIFYINIADISVGSALPTHSTDGARKWTWTFIRLVQSLEKVGGWA